ncbi:hypothetical protein ACM26V_06190 [Salipaludibacillus sp. HK11]|uniref:hypothetical protein n=1 Tax=Salipaludibacillus sp. HK11 TaxID=3394320 RepID=UPI0039FC7DDF
MNESVISINKLYPGMQLENDLYDQFNNLLYNRGTVLTNEHLKDLTLSKQAFLKYNLENNNNQVDISPLLLNINGFLRKITFVEECGVDLTDMKKNYYLPKSLLESDWEIQASYDYIKKINYKFIELATEELENQDDSLKSNLVSSCEKIAFWLNEVFWSQHFEPLSFYHWCLDWIDEHTNDISVYWQSYFVPFPVEANLLMKDGSECEVVEVSSVRPFTPLLRLVGNDKGMTYFVEELFNEVEKVYPMKLNYSSMKTLE